MPEHFDGCVRKVKRVLQKQRRKGNAYAICKSKLKYKKKVINSGMSIKDKRVRK